MTPNGLPSEATLALIESQISVINSTDLLSKVIDKAASRRDPEFNGTAGSLLPSPLTSFLSLFQQSDNKHRFLVTLGNLREKMDVTRSAKSFVIEIAITSRDADKSAELANAVAHAFIDQLGQVQAATARKASDALSSRLSELRSTVSDAEHAVETYKAQHQLVGVDGKLVDDTYIQRVNERLAQGRAEATALKVKADQMAKADVNDVVKGTLPEELTSDTLTRLRSTYSELAQQAAVLASTLGPKHPQRIASEQALGSSRQAIRGELSRIVAAAQTELARADATNRDLAAQLKSLKQKQLATSESFVKLRELEREVDASRAVYEAFLLRARETGEQESLNTANVRVISEATAPLRPSSMSRRVIVGIGAFLGLIAGIAIALLRMLPGAIRGVRRESEDTFDPASDRWGDRPGEMPPFRIVAGAGAGAGTGTGLADASPEVARSRGGFEDAMRPSVHAEPDAMRAPAAQEHADAETAEEELQHPASLPGSSQEQHEEPGHEPQEAAAAAGLAAAPAGFPPERVSLRERVRAIAEERARAVGAPGSEEDGEVVRLQREIANVKMHISDLRGRRELA